MFSVDYSSGFINMHQGDTGVFRFSAKRKSGADFTEYDRLLMTVKKDNVDIMQRIYRLDDDALGNGKAVIQFHNNDTDQWEPGDYPWELRILINPTWDGDPSDPIPTGMCVNGLTALRFPNEGNCVRTVIQSTIKINAVYGEV